MHCLREELLTVVEELCTDLFQSPRPADAEPALRSLASLAGSSPLAQKQLGQALVSSCPVTHRTTGRATTAVRLQLLVERFLYDGASAVATLALLAALAHGNVANQRRIAKHIAGVCVTIPHPASDHNCPPLVLLVVSLPNTLQNQYRQWNARHRELLARRVPTGSPPSRDGVPAACFCDECLGTPQLLATWVDHYGDLSRWSLRDEDDGQGASGSPDRLRSEAFLQKVLVADGYSLHQHPASSESQGAGVVYYFRAQDLLGDASLDPLLHACAIRVDASIADLIGGSTSITHSQLLERQSDLVEQDAKRKDDDGNESEEGEDHLVDRVLLFDQQVPLQHFEESRAAPITELSCGSLWLPSVARVLHTFAMAHESATIHELWSHVESASDDITVWESRVFLHILSFVESQSPLDIQLLVQQLGLDIQQQDHGLKLIERVDPNPAELCAVRVVALYQNQTLEITATTLAGSVFSTSLSSSSLVKAGMSAKCDVLGISEDSLLDVLHYCRLEKSSGSSTSFSLGDGGGGGGYIKLTPVIPDSITTPQDHDDSPAVHEAHDERTESSPSLPPHSRGFSPAAERQLHLLSEMLKFDHTVPLVRNVSVRIQRIIRDCNERIATLADGSHNTARPMPMPTEPQRQAGRERCRVCRDLLIQAAKRMKLGVRSDDATATLTTAATSRLQRAIARVRQLSETTDAWETPDARVQRLQLSKHEWASGVPDPEFYMESDARSTANRTAQRRLNQRLVQQMRQQRSGSLK